MTRRDVQPVRPVRGWYRIHDSRDLGKCIPLRTTADARRWNRQGWGVFCAVNDFGDGPRQISHLRRIRAWVCEADHKSKAEQFAAVERAPLPPSLIVESKSSLHLWWVASDATAATWDAIVRDRLKPFFGADPRATLLTQLLRVPGYYHLKDPGSPFLVRTVRRSERRYSEREMLDAFPDVGGAERRAREHLRAMQRRKPIPAGGDLWDRAMRLDCRDALERLSGHAAVGGERFTFRRIRNGWNIVADGRQTSCWVDHNGRIGSSDHGGPGIAQWIAWYGHDWHEVARVLREVFSELAEERAA